MGQTFFGFKPADRAKLHDNLFELIWQGEGRWTFSDIYTMPIPMRRFWIKKLNDKIEKRASKNTTSSTTTEKQITRAPEISKK